MPSWTTPPALRTEFEDSHIRVRRADGTIDWDATYATPERSRAQTRRDEILEESETLLRQARDLVDEALENLALLVTPQHRNLSTLIGQQIEQVIEFRRVAG